MDNVTVAFWWLAAFGWVLYDTVRSLPSFVWGAVGFFVLLARLDAVADEVAALRPDRL